MSKPFDITRARAGKSPLTDGGIEYIITDPESAMLWRVGGFRYEPIIVRKEFISKGVKAKSLTHLAHLFDTTIPYKSGWEPCSLDEVLEFLRTHSDEGGG